MSRFILAFLSAVLFSSLLMASGQGERTGRVVFKYSCYPGVSEHLYVEEMAGEKEIWGKSYTLIFSGGENLLENDEDVTNVYVKVDKSFYRKEEYQTTTTEPFSLFANRHQDTVTVYLGSEDVRRPEYIVTLQRYDDGFYRIWEYDVNELKPNGYTYCFPDKNNPEVPLY